MMHNLGSQGQKYADVCKHGVNVCKRLQTLDERMHNHGFQGTWLEFHRVINTDRASNSNPLRAGTRAHNLGSHGTWLECHRVINGGRYSMQFLRSIPWGPGLVGAAGRDSSAQPWIPGDLVGVPSSDQRGPGQHDAQPWIPGPEVCTTMDSWARSMHNLGSIGQKYADVCKHGVNVCRRLQTWGERMQTSANLG